MDWQCDGCRSSRLTQVHSELAGAAFYDCPQAKHVSRVVHLGDEGCRVMPQEQAHEEKRLGSLIRVCIQLVIFAIVIVERHHSEYGHLGHPARTTLRHHADRGRPIIALACCTGARSAAASGTMLLVVMLQWASEAATMVLFTMQTPQYRQLNQVLPCLMTERARQRKTMHLNVTYGWCCLFDFKGNIPNSVSTRPRRINLQSFGTFKQVG